MDTYIEDLVAVLHRAGPRAVLRYAGADTSGADLLDEIRRYARALDGLGVGPGDLVALFAPNRPDALAVRYAAHLIGAATVYLPAPDDPGRRAELVAHLTPTLVVVFPETVELLPAGVPAPTVTVGAVRDLDTGSWARLDRLAAAASAEALPARAQPGDVAVVASSGGTTGVPKGSTRDFASYTELVAAPGPAQDRRQLANGKLAYLTQVLVDQTLLAGGTVVLQDGYDAVATLAAVERDRITHLFLVEPQLFALMDHPDLARYDLTSLRAVTHIGSTAAPVLRRRARERLGPVVMHTYGASEVGIVSVLTAAEHDRPAGFRSVGRIQPGVDVRFRRSDGTLDPCAGAIEVRSPAMAQGYRNRPAEDAAQFVDGWFRTGDLGRLDDDGMLRVLGRATDIGELGAATLSDLQDTLCRQPSVRYADLVSDPQGGVRVAAAEAWPGGMVDAEACRAAVAAEHGPDVAATLRLLPVERVPLTEQGKPNRCAIWALAANLVCPSGPHDDRGCR